MGLTCSILGDSSRGTFVQPSKGRLTAESELCAHFGFTQPRRTTARFPGMVVDIDLKDAVVATDLNPTIADMFLNLDPSVTSLRQAWEAVEQNPGRFDLVSDDIKQSWKTFMHDYYTMRQSGVIPKDYANAQNKPVWRMVAKP